MKKQTKIFTFSTIILSIIILSLSVGLIFQFNVIKPNKLNENFDCMIYDPSTDRKIKYSYTDSDGFLSIIVPYANYNELSVYLFLEDVYIEERDYYLVSNEGTFLRFDLFEYEIVESTTLLHLYFDGLENTNSLSHLLIEIEYT